MARFETLNEQIEARGAWQLFQRVETVLSKLKLDGEVAFAGLSGGMKRRVLLARALVREPDMARALFYSHTMTDEEAADYWARLQNESFRAFLDMLVLDLPKPRKVAAALPRWVVGGGQDQIFPPQVVQRTAAAYRCKARIYPDMAHNLMLDHGWARVAEDLSRWVGRLQRDARAA